MRPFPDNLNELRLISVKTSPYLMSGVVETLSEHCLLKKLALVDCSLSDAHLPHLLTMMSNARFLIEIDVSWSQMTPFLLLELTEFLAENRQLRIVNLSYNPLTSHTKKAQFNREMAEDEVQLRSMLEAQRNGPDSPSASKLSGYNSKMSKTSNERNEKAVRVLVAEHAQLDEHGQIIVQQKRPRPKHKEDMTMSEYEECLEEENSASNGEHNISVIRNIERFVKRNKQLLHLDLTQTNLTEYMLW